MGLYEEFQRDRKRKVRENRSLLNRLRRRIRLYRLLKLRRRVATTLMKSATFRTHRKIFPVGLIAVWAVIGTIIIMLSGWSYIYVSSVATMDVSWDKVEWIAILITLIALSVLAYKKGWVRKAKWGVVTVAVLAGLFLTWRFWPGESAELLATAIPTAVATPIPDTSLQPTCHLSVQVTREWTTEIALARGQTVSWMPRSAVTYQILTTSDNEVVTFPATPEEPIKVKSPLAPSFKFRSIDADSLTLDVYIFPMECREEEE